MDCGNKQANFYMQGNTGTLHNCIMSSKFKYFLPSLSIQVGTNLPQFLSKLEDDKERKQPFVLLLGEPLSPSQQFLIVERLAIPQSSVIGAVDACFKSFYVLNIEYPKACKSVWEFFQFGCYKMPGNTRSVPAVARSLISVMHAECEV